MTDPLANDLTELAQNGKTRSETDRLADYFDHIEAALGAGVSRTEILETLHRHGFTLAIRGFDKAMRSLRKRARPAHTSTAIQPPQAACKMEATAQNSATQAIPPEPENTAVVPRKPIIAGNRPELPDDWRTTKLTPDQARMLTPDQKLERQKARENLNFPNRFKDPDAQT